ncbi:protein-L-isoaspartate(D-aspartate) O-methyltransferase [bacterium]|nr:protein-L-isoaspartate(D-aspartate) O-methyltransferase [candidate division CSSED10-310 bacterium]
MNREAMIDFLKNSGYLSSPEIVRAMSRIPRHEFVDPAFSHQAYKDTRLPIGCEQTISKPSTVAFMTELLDVKPNHRILEIGSGSGYQTAILSELCRKVYSVEWHMQLVRQAKDRLLRLGYSTTRIEQGDGSQGWPSAAPFDRIIITAGAPDIPETVCYQLVNGGIMVLPVGARDAQKMIKIQRTDCDNDVYFDITYHGDCEFVDLIGRLGWTESA